MYLYINFIAVTINYYIEFPRISSRELTKLLNHYKLFNLSKRRANYSHVLKISKLHRASNIHAYKLIPICTHSRTRHLIVITYIAPS